MAIYGVKVVTDKPVAVDSLDHQFPHGTAKDNSINIRFNQKLSWWIPADDLRVLDLGCAGGGFVRSLLDQGSFAIGIEGSDYSKTLQRAEWAVIPSSLFTADITVPFRVVYTDGPRAGDVVRFNVVTAWEVMEHIPEDKIESLMDNIRDHLAPSSIVLMSISTVDDRPTPGVNLHRTVRPGSWWRQTFAQFGFRVVEGLDDYFGDDWVRGVGEAGSFTIAMVRGPLPYAQRLAEAKRLLAEGALVPIEAYSIGSVRRQVQRGDYGEALRMLRVLESAGSLDAEAQYLMALSLHMHHAAIFGSLDYYERALQDGFDEFWIRYNRGTFYSNAGALDLALRDLERASSLDPCHEGAKEELRRVIGRLGEQSRTTP